ncbi:carbon-nitrogen hydrolase family protein [Marinomonas fungiae]|uniref:Predicted amidohydrolase n=1 Tax=Marinomonas fungiae TaxID=1137284 RepID=A0A0K6IJJ1_9GAMM|nr:carbon-nitrogen hydrolase family protein [Marinomonas fungiae]CUB03241.1 Predicted amidohydrolase [Marinomonas fungiae]
MSKLSVVSIQLTSGADWQVNLNTVLDLMTAALVHAPRLIVLPENVFLFDAKQMRAVAEGEATEQILSALSVFAQQHQTYILIGSHPMAFRPNGEQVEGGRVRQSSILISDQGEQVARYDKIHLFDVQVADKAAVYKESRFIEPGEIQATVFDIDGVVLGLSICYDLRFPELYRLLMEKGADLIAVPSAFTHRTGAAHWHALLQARAIENQCYITGVNQAGWHNETRQTYGNTVAYSPWGERLACLDDEQVAWLHFEVDTEYRQAIKTTMPCAEHRRIVS